MEMPLIISEIEYVDVPYEMISINSSNHVSTTSETVCLPCAFHFTKAFFKPQIFEGDAYLAEKFLFITNLFKSSRGRMFFK